MAASFTNFTARSGGNNLNAGTVDGSATEPATTALVTYTGGDWNSATDVYTAPVGANMTEAQAGRFASLYHDGDTSPTTNQYLVARITAVDSGARTITLSTTARALLGTEVATGTGTRSLRIGGAWAGPSGAVAFPFNCLSSALLDPSSNPTRLNLKNDQTYSVTAALTPSSAGPPRVVRGYSETYGDGGRAVIDGGTSGAAYVVLSLTSGTSAPVALQDLEVKNNGASGSANLVSCANTNFYAFRCVFRSSRGNGLSLSAGSGGATLTECEFYDCNQSNTASQAGLVTSSIAGVSCVRCFFHDNTGSNTRGVRVAAAAVSVAFLGCVFDTNGSHGLEIGNSMSALVSGCDFYGNGGDAFRMGAAVPAHVENSNFLNNTAIALDANAVGSVILACNCGFGSGTMANDGGNTAGQVEESGSVTYDANTTPWVDPDDGDFRINLSAAYGTGRGTFLQTATSYSGTVGYPDIGAAQHQDVGGGFFQQDAGLSGLSGLSGGGKP